MDAGRQREIRRAARRMAVIAVKSDAEIAAALGARPATIQRMRATDDWPDLRQLVDDAIAARSDDAARRALQRQIALAEALDGLCARLMKTPGLKASDLRTLADTLKEATLMRIDAENRSREAR